MNNRISNKKIYRIVIIVFASLFLLYNLVVCFSQTLYSSLDYDELQHIHIAWNTARGEIMYKDFFEHHGPLYSLLNGLLFNLFGLKAGFGVVYFYRVLSLIYLFLIVFLTFLSGRHIFNSVPMGLCAAALLSILVFFQDKATEIRPDVLQNLFSLAAFFLLLRNINKNDLKRNIAAGTLLGLMLMCNSKTFIIIAAIIIYLFIDNYMLQRKIKTFFYNIMAIFIPTLVIFLLFYLYFALNGVLYDFLFYAYQFPFMVLTSKRPNLPGEYLLFFFKNQLSFLLLSIPGFGLLLKTIIDNYKNKKNFQKLIFLFITTVVTLSTSILPLYKQQYLTFLPFLALTAIYGFVRIHLMLKKRMDFNKIQLGIEFSLIILLFAGLLPASLNSMLLFQNEQKLTEQKNLTEYIIKNTSRNEKIMIVWTDAGGYMFNDDLQYYWYAAEDTPRLFNQIRGYDVFGEHLVRLIQEQQLRYIIARPWEFQKAWPDGYVFNFVNHFYYQHDKLPGLWVRNQ